jgi:hypothetical protein
LRYSVPSRDGHIRIRRVHLELCPEKMVKLGIEGVEYALLNEAYDTGILCDYVAEAVRVDLLVETHPLYGRICHTIKLLFDLLM